MVTGKQQMKGVAGVAAIVVAVIGVAVIALRIAAAASSQPLPVSYGFDGNWGWRHGEVDPGAIYFGAGGSLLVKNLTWSSWTQGEAVGRGVRWADGCVPTCAAGRYVKSPAILTLSRVRTHAGTRYFARLTVRWTASGRVHTDVFAWSGGAEPGAPPFWS
jgi:hypothetical protein